MGQPNNIVQTNFTAGEISPRLRGQVDQKKHSNGARTQLNMVSYVHGGATRRVGSGFVSEIRDSTAFIRLIPFIFSTTQNYILEFGNLYAQVYRQRGQVNEASIVIASIVNGNPTTINTAVPHGWATNDRVNLSGLKGLLSLNNKMLVATVTGASQITVAFDTTVDPAYTASSGNISRVYTIALPYTTADLPSVKFTQSADTLYLSNGKYEPSKLTRTADTSWSYTKLASTFGILDGPYLNQNTTATTITPSGTSGSITLTASTAIFASTDINRLVRIFEGAAWGWAIITAFTSSTVVTATVQGTALSASVATTQWRLGAWSDTTGWPQVVTFHQQRLLFAANTSQPQTIWGSNTGDFQNFAPSNAAGTISDNNAFTFTISDDQVNAIRWMSSGPVLLIGTAQAEYTMYAGTTNSYAPITPSNVNIKRESTHGSTPNSRVKRIGVATLYIQNSKRRVREAAYSYVIDGYASTDITLFSEHIGLSGFTDFDYQEELDPVGWFSRTDGTLVGLTYDKDQAVNGWHRHILGGSYTDLTTPGALPGQACVESVGVIPDPTGIHGDLWMSVKRTINGVTRRYIEYLTDPFDPDTNGQRSANFVDAGLTYNGYYSASITPAATTGSGITITSSLAVFSANDVGRQIRSGSARATVTAFTDSSHVVVNIISPFASLSPIIATNWYMGAQNFNGIGHLEGESCQVLGDGAVLPNVTPTRGQFSLDDFYGMVTVGEGYISELEQLPTENQSIGTSQGLIKRIHGANIYLYRSLGLKYGPRDTKLDQLPFRGSQDNMNAPPPLFTGIKRVPFPAGYENEPVVQLRQDQPLPMTVLFITQEQEIYG